ncbi:unnamed protein product [Mytilus edulis]|uniref:Uncharacterized protein n=1 Tax=Mytilus edulis TaxID=6550 RepID=A0A8S3U3L7_MYTED|nr:unnamed protein product [Mytilus edulis]
MQKKKAAFSIDTCTFKKKFCSYLKDKFTCNPWLEPGSDVEFKNEVKKYLRADGLAKDTSAYKQVVSFASSKYADLRNQLRRKIFQELTEGKNDLQSLQIDDFAKVILSSFCSALESYDSQERIQLCLIIVRGASLPPNRAFQTFGTSCRYSTMKPPRGAGDEKWEILAGIDSRRIIKRLEVLAVRAGHKSAVKRLLRKTEDDSNLDNEESAELLETLIQKQKIISALDEDIMNSLKEEDIEEEILNADEYKFFLNTKIRHLRKTFANKLCTDNDIPQHDHALPSHTFENINQHTIKEDVLDTDKEAKILGMRWNVETDELSYAKRVLPSVSSNITKREILKESSKLFDPLGFLSPVSIRAKILMQDLWKERYDWDEPLPENLQLQWKDLAKDIGIVTSMKLPRQYFTGNTNSR